MTQQTINIGATPNDGDGDPLRTAMDKVNDNFNELYANTGVNSNIRIANNTVYSINTNGNLVLRGNGLGQVDVGYIGNLRVTGGSNGYVIQTDGAGNLSFADIANIVYSNADVAAYLLTNTGNIQAGNLAVLAAATVGTDLVVQGNLTVNGTTTTVNTANVDIEDKNITLAYGTTTEALANGAGITIAGANATMTYVSATDSLDFNKDIIVAGNVTASDGSNTWTISGQYITGPGGAYWHSHPEQQQSIFASAPGEFVSIRTIDGNLVTQGELFLGNTYAQIFVENGVNRRWRFDESGITEFPGDITPTTPVGYTASVGNATSPWLNATFSGNVTANSFIGDGSQLTGITSYANANAVAYGEAGWAGNIIPSANATYSLGNATNYWSNLWVANNTIYIGGVPLGVSGNVLTVNGEPVLSNDSNTAITTTGNITANYFIGNGSQLTGLSDGTAIVNGTSQIDIPTANGNIYVGVNNIGSTEFTALGINTLDLVALGNVTADGTVQGNVVTADSAINTSGTIAATGNITASANINADGGTFTGNITSTGNITTTRNIDVTGFLFAGVVSSRNSGVLSLVGSNVDITTGNVNLTTATATRASTIIASGNITGANLVTAATVFADAVDANSATIDGNLVVDGNVTATADLTLRAGAGGTINFPVTGGNIEFDAATGNVVFPGGVYTGDVSTTGNISITGNITPGNILTDGYFYANGDPFVSSNYGDSNVVTLMSAFGSNTITTTGNITAANFIGNVSLTGNITGTSANVELVAGSYTWTFDNTGIVTLPAVGGDEGGEINFGIPTANTTLSTTVKMDVYQDRIRFFDGSTKGVYIDLSQADAGVGTALGYLNIPQVTLSANTTAALSDSGKHFYSTTAGNLSILIPTNANVAFPTGTAFTVVTQAAGNVLVNADAGVTLYMAGSSSAGNRTVGAYGMATVMKVATDTWFINGSGVY